MDLVVKYGVNILTCSADVSDYEQLSNVIIESKTKFGNINGIIHNAGEQGGGSIQFKEKMDVNEVFSPKIHGTKNLYHLFKDDNPDFMLLSSSSASVLGLYGLVDYCSANAFPPMLRYVTGE